MACMPPPDLKLLAAIVLTGGRSTRMGEDKGARIWGARRAVDWVVDLAERVGAAQVITAGGFEYGYDHVPDPTPHAGPVSGILAGLDRLDGRFARVLVLAVDAPTVSQSDLRLLMATAGPGASFTGMPLPMVIDASLRPADVQSDWPLRRFVERAGLAQLVAAPESMARLRGANTPEEQALLMRKLPP